MLGYLAVSGFVLTKYVKYFWKGGIYILFFLSLRLRSPVGGMTMREQQLEGTLRFVNSRVITSRWVIPYQLIKINDGNYMFLLKFEINGTEMHLYF